MSPFVPVWRKIAIAGAVLAGINVLAWAWAFAAFGGNTVLLGTALLAYTFGLRHAVDADHIAAIDCVTRKLVHEGKRPVSVGLFFSLGHSTIVVLMAAAIAVSALAVRTHFSQMQASGGTIGTIVSVVFLIVIAIINVRVLLDTLRNGYADPPAPPGGVLARVLKPVLHVVDAAWKMYPVGVLFGLGFDTATEVGLLGIAAIEAGKGLPIVDIMIFPILFTAGMSLLDTTDGVLMLGAYGWACLHPERKVAYNVAVTSASIVAALIIAGIEAVNFVAAQYGFDGGLWSLAALATSHFEALGATIVVVLLIGWALSVLANRLRSQGGHRRRGVA